MPLRTPACRSAVHRAVLRHVQPIWITDDLLADAFHRFLNVSDANHKRYGSNVPGPLEARRRASKRRMMGLAAASPAIGPDIGALFGPDKLHQPWGWEPPKTAEQSLSWEKPPPPAISQWLSDYNGSAEKRQTRTEEDLIEEYRRRLACVRDVTELETLWLEIGAEPQYSALLSQMANTHFLDMLKSSNIKTPNTLFLEPKTQPPYEALWAFLRNPKLNVPEARNIKTVINVAIKDGMDPRRLRKLIDSIRDSLRLGAMLPSELRKVVDSIPSLCAKVFPDPAVANDWRIGAYWAIWRGMTSCKILPIDHFGTSIPRKIVKSLLVLDTPPEVEGIAKPKRRRPRDAADPVLFRLEMYRYRWPTRDDARPDDLAAHLVFWIQTLGKLGICGSDCTPNGLGWHVIKSVLQPMSSTKVREVIIEATALLLPLEDDVALDEETQNTVRLWFSCISQTSHFQHPTTGHFDIFATRPAVAARIDPVLAIPYLECFPIDKIYRFWTRYWLPQYVDKDMGHKKKKKNWVEKAQRALNSRVKQLDSAEDPRVALFFNAVVTLNGIRLPYKSALLKAVEFVVAMYGPDVAHDLHTRLVLARLPIDSRSSAAVIEAMSEENPRQALKFFKSIPDVSLSLCPRLPLRLIEHGSLPRDELFALLDRNDPLARVPPEHRHTMTNSLSTLRLELVHIIAHAYANQTAFPTRHRFRNVYFCYLWLRDRKAPLQPLFAKALVRAAVTAPLENREWVSTIKLRWVLRLVREIEGAEVAGELDRLVWRWRGDVIREARARWDAAGLFARFGPSTVTWARRAGLFDRDRPAWRRSYRKRVMNAGFRAPKCVRKVRFQPRGARGARRVWARLDRGMGGKNGWWRPYSPWKWRLLEAY
ncbi:hypothetical protein SLS58_007939 [Diplodia intermedia]|uniref:Pentatricopeptide repeat domain-containing protein n=1 Tax=Diplodia intermedia TaxID=856260 RepID=A0ABR3TJU5_9PEZI